MNWVPPVPWQWGHDRPEGRTALTGKSANLTDLSLPVSSRCKVASGYTFATTIARAPYSKPFRICPQVETADGEKFR